MATLLNCNAISKHFVARALFDGLSISFADDERVGMLGPNGSGKTTFLKILAGLEPVDTGEVSRRRSLRIGLLEQEDRFEQGASVASVLVDAMASSPLGQRERNTQVSIVLSKFGFQDPGRPLDELSGGWRKRLALAREVVRQPDMLLLDEPTNHLDLEGIQWLEQMLLSAPFPFLAVSHDRYFLERVTTRVVELNPLYPDGYFSVNGNYSVFLQKRADFLVDQQARQVTLTNIVRREDAFLKSQAKARRTKAKSRIDEAYRLKDELRDLKQRSAKGTAAGIEFDGTGRQSKKLLEAKGLAKTLGGKRLFEDVSLLLSPGTRLGLLGANGSGKTTLIRLLTGDLAPDEGTVETADNLRVVVFDQKREELPQDATLRHALAGKSNSVDFRGREIHLTAWAKRFLFDAEQLSMPVGGLSGGEQARILIARLMLRPADLLILDEPTNDLDMASLEMLEESLLEFPGAIVLVTHDRFMLERVCTNLLGLSGEGRVGKYVDCAHWQTANASRPTPSTKDAENAKAKKRPRSASRMTASEIKELQNMEETIKLADEAVEQCRLATQDPEVAGDHVEAAKRWDALQAATSHVEALYTRWEALEAKKG